MSRIFPLHKKLLYHSLLYSDGHVNPSKGLLNVAGYIINFFSWDRIYSYISRIFLLSNPKVFETQHLMGVSCMGAHCQVPSHTFKKKLPLVRLEPTTSGFIVLDAPTELMWLHIGDGWKGWLYTSHFIRVTRWIFWSKFFRQLWHFSKTFWQLLTQSIW